MHRRWRCCEHDIHALGEQTNIAARWAKWRGWGDRCLGYKAVVQERCLVTRKFFRSDEGSCEREEVCVNGKPKLYVAVGDLRDHDFGIALWPVVVLHDSRSLCSPFVLVKHTGNTSFESRVEGDLMLRPEKQEQQKSD